MADHPQPPRTRQDRVARVVVDHRPLAEPAQLVEPVAAAHAAPAAHRDAADADRRLRDVGAGQQAAPKRRRVVPRGDRLSDHAGQQVMAERLRQQMQTTGGGVAQRRQQARPAREEGAAGTVGFVGLRARPAAVRPGEEDDHPDRSVRPAGVPVVERAQQPQPQSRQQQEVAVDEEQHVAAPVVLPPQVRAYGAAQAIDVDRLRPVVAAVQRGHRHGRVPDRAGRIRLQVPGIHPAVRPQSPVRDDVMRRTGGLHGPQRTWQDTASPPRGPTPL